MKSLIEELPKIVADGKKEVSKILENLENGHKITLQTNEYVLPVEKGNPLYQKPIENPSENIWLNRLCYGDNLFVIQALLNGDSATGLPSMRGMIDLIYIIFIARNDLKALSRLVNHIQNFFRQAIFQPIFVKRTLKVFYCLIVRPERSCHYV